MHRHFPGKLPGGIGSLRLTERLRLRGRHMPQQTAHVAVQHRAKPRQHREVRPLDAVFEIQRKLSVLQSGTRRQLLAVDPLQTHRLCQRDFKIAPIPHASPPSLSLIHI